MMQDVQANAKREATTLQHAMVVVVAYVANNHVQPADLADLIKAVHTTFAQLANPVAEPAEPEFVKPSPSAIRRSITPEALISFIDGKPYQTLKRHLAKNGLDFAGYRTLYGLPSDYPSTSPNFSAKRAELARGMGLGRKGQRGPRTDTVETDAAPSAEAAPKRRGRPPKTA